jgi:hypothetical protein
VLILRRPFAIAGNGSRLVFGYNLDRYNESAMTPGMSRRVPNLFDAERPDPV